MSALTKDGSYLKKEWDEFGDLEGKCTQACAREVGVSKSIQIEPNSNGTVSVCIQPVSEPALDALGKNDVEKLELVDTVPDYVIKFQFKFSDFASRN